MRCLAAGLWEAGKPLVIQEVEVDPPQATEVRIKVKFTSLCYTDLYFGEAKAVAGMTAGVVDRSVECTGKIDAMISAIECVHDGWGVAVLVECNQTGYRFRNPPMNALNERTLK